MKNLNIANKFFASAFLGLALCSGCEAEGDSYEQGQELTQLESSYIMDSEETEYGVGLSFWLGSWDVTGQDCVEIRVIRHPDAPMQLDVDWLNDDNQTLASRPVDLRNKLTEAFELRLDEYPGQAPDELHLVGNAMIDADLDNVNGTLINTIVRPCR